MVYTTVDELSDSIINAATQYYNGLPCELTDEQFDAKVEQLKKLKPDHWVLKSTGWGYKPSGEKCPHIGSSPVSGIGVKLKYPEMGSDYQRVALTIPNFDAAPGGLVAEGNCLTMPKFDGASVVVYFTNSASGKLEFKALTRGRDNIGVDVTEALKVILQATCPDVFKMISGSYRKLLSIRGEVIVPREHEEAMLATGMKNTRNAASGILNRKELSDELKYLQFVPYFIRIDTSTREYTNQADMLEEIWRLGFTKFDVFRLSLPNPETLRTVFEITKKKYPVDGLVLCNLTPVKGVEHDYTLLEQNTLAYKFESEVADVVVKEILWQVGGQGSITPVCKFEPVSLAGAMVEKATAHNYENLLTQGIGPGATISVTRSGEVIPYLVGVKERAQKLFVPTHCPECEQKLSVVGVHLKCGNENCGPRALASINKLIEVSGEVEGLDDTTIVKWCDGAGIRNLRSALVYIKNLIDFPTEIVRDFGPYYTKLLSVLFANLIRKFQEGYTYQEFWYICNLASISDSNSKKIASKDPREVTIENFGGMGLAVNILKSLADNQTYWKELSSMVKFKPFVEPPKEGITFCVTGKLSMGRDEFVKKASERGFTFHDSVKKITQYLVCNEESGSSKTQKAEKNGTKIVTEEQFWKLEL